MTNTVSVIDSPAILNFKPRSLSSVSALVQLAIMICMIVLLVTFQLVRNTIKNAKLLIYLCILLIGLPKVAKWYGLNHNDCTIYPGPVKRSIQNHTFCIMEMFSYFLPLVNQLHNTIT